MMSWEHERAAILEELERIVQQIWLMTLKREISPCEEVSCLGDSRHVSIEISGAWDGALRVSFSELAAENVTRDIFELSDDETPEDVQINDALKEIANVAGGNLKTFLPEPSVLSLPKVLTSEEGERRSAEGKSVSLCLCSEDKEPVRFLLQKDG
ncbi:chemotaxis protein CheX [bacterium]|nr:chemotaxis protein CheX [bacterium]